MPLLRTPAAVVAVPIMLRQLLLACVSLSAVTVPWLMEEAEEAGGEDGSSDGMETVSEYEV